MTYSNEPSGADLFRAAVGERILMWRETLGISRSALAEKASLSVGYIRRIERGRANPTVAALQALAIALDADLHELLDVNGDELGIAAAEQMKRR